MAQASAFEVCGLTGLIRHGAPAHSSGPDFHSLAMLPREQALRHERRATNAPLRGDDCQFAPGFKSANPRKNRRVEKPSLCWNSRCSMEQFDAVAEAAELADHSGCAPLLGSLTDRWAAFLVTHSFMQNLPD